MKAQTSQFKVEWEDKGFEPRCPPNPAYPEGIDLNCAGRAVNSCVCTLPYPAKRCGFYKIQCNTCGFRVVCTTAGRPDDPRSVEMPCQTKRSMTHV